MGYYLASHKEKVVTMNLFYIFLIQVSFILILLLSFKYGFKPKCIGSTYIVGKKRRGKTTRLTLGALKVMKDKERLKKSNLKIDKLKKGGFFALTNVNQLVYSDLRITKCFYHSSKLLNLQQKYDNNVLLTQQEKLFLQKNLSNYVNGFNVGAKYSGISLFDKITFPPYSHCILDEINKYYNSRLSIDFPDAVATWHQTNGHNNVSFEMSAHRLPEPDAKIREIMDYYELVRFKWDFKFYYPKFIKTFPFIKIASYTYLTIIRVWHYTDIEEIEQKKKPHSLILRFVRWFLGFPYESGRKIYSYVGCIYNHFDSEYLKPYHYDKNSNFNYLCPPYHNYNLEQYENFIQKTFYIRPIEFGRESKRDRKKRIQTHNK